MQTEFIRVRGVLAEIFIPRLLYLPPHLNTFQRGAGKTRWQIEHAPRESYYVYPKGSYPYVRAMIHGLNRADLRLTSPDVFLNDRYHGIMRMVIDHAVDLGPKALDIAFYLASTGVVYTLPPTPLP